jgi:hypothetical protein
VVVVRPFFARFFIGIILGLAAEFAFMRPWTKLMMSSFASTLDRSPAERWLEVPAWMFDRTACPDAEPLTAQPFVSIDALAALSALFEWALKDRTPSVALLSGACRASHDQNRGETHVTQERNARERSAGLIAARRARGTKMQAQNEHVVPMMQGLLACRT